jgi:antitoxin VapB
MPLYIKDETTTRLVNELARKRGLTKQKAVRLAVEAELERAERAIPLRERLKQLWDAHPLPPPTGHAADKAFYDELSGEP